MFIGIMLLLIGIFMLLDKMGIIHGDLGDYLIAIALISLGASMVFNKKNK